jgi:hypothetical protein
MGVAQLMLVARLVLASSPAVAGDSTLCARKDPPPVPSPQMLPSGRSVSVLQMKVKVRQRSADLTAALTRGGTLNVDYVTLVPARDTSARRDEALEVVRQYEETAGGGVSAAYLRACGVRALDERPGVIGTYWLRRGPDGTWSVEQSS